MDRRNGRCCERKAVLSLANGGETDDEEPGKRLTGIARVVEGGRTQGGVGLQIRK
jgi:hypothetical protein